MDPRDALKNMKIIPRYDFKLSVLFSVLCAMLAMVSACRQQPVYPPPAVRGHEVIVDLSALKNNIPLFQTYQYNGKNISFFVMALEGRVVSFFDACASCYRHKMGYRYDDGFVTCRYCNMKFALHKLEKGLGGCYPIKIEGITGRVEYRIPKALLEKGAYLF
jgi:uncharacterized membrane protein